MPAPVVLLYRSWLLLAHLNRRRSDFAVGSRLLLYSLTQLLLLSSALLRCLSLRLPLRFGLLLHGGTLLLLLLCSHRLLARGLSLRSLVQANTFGLGALFRSPRGSLVFGLRRRRSCVLLRNRCSRARSSSALLNSLLLLKLLHLASRLLVATSGLRREHFHLLLSSLVRGGR